MSSRTITWDNLNTSTMGQFDSTLKDTIFKKHFILNKLREKQKTYDGGVFLAEPIMNKRGNGGSYTGMQDLTPVDKQLVENAIFEPAHYEVDISLSYTDDLANRGKSAVFDLLEAKYENAKKTMEYNLTTALFGDGVKATYGMAPLVGLKAAVPIDPTSNPTAGAYGGITRDSTTATDFWKNQYTATGVATTALTMKMLQNLWGKCSDGADHPDVIVTTQAIFDRLWELADARQQLGVAEVAKMGYQNIYFNGVPLIVDKNCSDYHVYMLNTDYLYLKVHQDDDMVATPFLQGTTQLVKTKYITWTGQLICCNPRYQGILTVTS
ncbi:phage major capsid protein [Sulfuricurvum sp.]|uniref:phage major capsid protein n=1 Tax=Sulfuricurvum sp. TaxID=2025608 RepID=UPI00356323A1